MAQKVQQTHIDPTKPGEIVCAYEMKEFLDINLEGSEKYSMNNSPHFTYTRTSVYLNEKDKIAIFFVTKIKEENIPDLICDLENLKNEKYSVIPLMHKIYYFNPLANINKIAYPNDNIERIIGMTKTEIAIMNFSNKNIPLPETKRYEGYSSPLFYFESPEKSEKKIESYRFKKHPVQQGLNYFTEEIQDIYTLPFENPRYIYITNSILKGKINIEKNQFVKIKK